MQAILVLTIIRMRYFIRLKIRIYFPVIPAVSGIFYLKRGHKIFLAEE